MKKIVDRQGGGSMKRRHIKYAGFIFLCVAGCMLMTACNGKKASAEKQDSVISSEAESQDAADDAQKSGSQNAADDTKQSGAQNAVDNVQKSDSQDATSDEAVDPADYEVGTREHYIADIAQEQGIPYDTADEQEKQEADKITLNDGESIGYMKLDQECGTVANGKGCIEKVFMSADVRYIYNRSTERIIAVDKLENAKLYIPEVPDVKVTASDFEIEEEGSGYNIHVIASLYFTLDDPNVEEAGEFIGVQSDGKQSTVSTVGKRFATHFFYKDVKN